MVKMMLVFVVALVLSTNPVKATDCLSVFASISSCKSYLGNSLPVLPGTQCCDAATNVVSMADTESLCHCLRQSPISSSFIPSKAQQLPSLCNVNSFVPLTNCLVPSGENNVFPLPPDTPLPPLIPFPPLLPTVPLPPVFPFPIPPLVPVPVQPVPLPPIQPIPFPPLVPIPVPPVA